VKNTLYYRGWCDKTAYCHTICRGGRNRTGRLKMQDRKRRTKKRAGRNWRTTVAHIIKQNTRVPDAPKLQIIQLSLRWEKQRESIKVSMNILR